jgi:hypothetical protein
MLDDEGRHAALTQQDGIRGGQVLGDDDPPADVHLRQRRHVGVSAEKLLDLPHDVVDVIAPRAQIGVFHLVEDLDQCVALRFQGPAGVDGSLADHLARRVDQRRVGHHQQVCVDELGDVLRRAGGNLLAHPLQVAARAVQRRVQPRQFRRDAGGRNGCGLR